MKLRYNIVITKLCKAIVHWMDKFKLHAYNNEFLFIEWTYRKTSYDIWTSLDSRISGDKIILDGKPSELVDKPSYT